MKTMRGVTPGKRISATSFGLVQKNLYKLVGSTRYFKIIDTRPGWMDGSESYYRLLEILNREIDYLNYRSPKVQPILTFKQARENLKGFIEKNENLIANLDSSSHNMGKAVVDRVKSSGRGRISAYTTVLAMIDALEENYG